MLYRGLSLCADVETLRPVGARRDYDGWVEGDALDPEAAAVLAYLDRLADARPELADALGAHIDRYGVVTSTISLSRGVELYLQAGEGWDRVLWTCPSGRVHEWTWRERAPEDLDALLAGRGVERTTWLGARLAGARLVVDDRTMAITEGRLWLAVLRRLGIRTRERDEPAL
jgi:hypothetical protein